MTRPGGGAPPIHHAARSDAAGLPGARSSDITRRYVAAYFDLHLRKQAPALLDKPSTRSPEVKHCPVETKTCQ
ncbi:hypothetical protein [Planotetraspora sp. GP83]|uniref:hypothetical protein n=1 Tax=Planotetraspora sp. GP83 TaxID=3156264 RepID=UPI003516F51A